MYRVCQHSDFYNSYWLCCYGSCSARGSCQINRPSITDTLYHPSPHSWCHHTLWHKPWNTSPIPCLRLFVTLSLMPCIPYHIPEFELHNVCSHHATFGRGSTQMLGSGPALGFSAKELRSTTTPSHLLAHLRHQMPGLTTYTLTLLDHCLCVWDALTSSCVDRFTWWPEAFPLPDITASIVAQAFVHDWISHFGITSTITTDRGAQFLSPTCCIN